MQAISCLCGVQAGPGAKKSRWQQVSRQEGGSGSSLVASCELPPCHKPLSRKFMLVGTPPSKKKPCHQQQQCKPAPYRYCRRIRRQSGNICDTGCLASTSTALEGHTGRRVHVGIPPTPVSPFVRMCHVCMHPMHDWTGRSGNANIPAHNGAIPNVYFIIKLSPLCCHAAPCPQRFTCLTKSMKEAPF